MAKIEQKMGNICWDCKKSTGGCSWSGIDLETKKPLFEPVPGWTAEPVKLRIATDQGTHQGIFVDTYSITACPLFEHDDQARIDKQAFVKISKDRTYISLNSKAFDLLPPNTTSVNVTLLEWKKTIQITASNAIRSYKVTRIKTPTSMQTRIHLMSLLTYLGRDSVAAIRCPATRIPNGFEFQYTIVGDEDE